MTSETASKWTVVASLALVSMVASGCSTESPGSASPAASTQSSDAGPIPPVTEPLDLTSLAQRPCDLLTAEQASAFGFASPNVDEGATGSFPACVWKTTNDVRMSVFPQADLETVFAKRDQYTFFELTKFSGYPAAVYTETESNRLCTALVKVAEGQGVAVNYITVLADDPPPDPCAEAVRVAEVVLTNIPSAAG